MREAVLFALLALLSVACVTRVDVQLGEGQDLSQLRTWRWLPSGASPEVGVDAPHRDEQELHARLGRLVERRLVAKGYEQAEPADFFVVYHLLLQPRTVAVLVPRAPYLLLSMSSSPSYWIEGSDEEIRVYEDFRLIIGLLTKPGKLVWRGVFERKVEEGKGLALDRAVAELLERLPAPAPDPDRDPPSRLDASALPGLGELARR